MEYSLLAWQSWEVGRHLHTPLCSGVIPGSPCQTPAAWGFSSVTWSPVIVFSHFLLICLLPTVWRLPLPCLCLLFFLRKQQLDILPQIMKVGKKSQGQTVIYTGEESWPLQRSHVRIETLFKPQTCVPRVWPKSYGQKLLRLAESIRQRKPERRRSEQRGREKAGGSRGCRGKAGGEKERFDFRALQKSISMTVSVTAQGRRPSSSL